MNRSFLRLVRPAVMAALIASGMTFAGTAHAVSSFTNVNLPVYGGEESVAQILNHTYGGNFTLQNPTLNYNNGLGISAIRVADNLLGGTSTNLVNIGNGNNDDRIWSDGIASGTAMARFAGYNQKFGYFKGASGGSYQNLLDVTGSGYNLGGSTFAAIDMGTLMSPDPTIWRWGRSGDGTTWSSSPLDNGANQNDHMVTYMITGLNDAAHVGKTTWMLFWEDLDLSDADYNDLAVEVIAQIKPGIQQVPDPSSTPEPATAALGMMGLAALGVAASRRRSGR